MKIFKGRQMGKSVEIEEIPMSSMTLLPPKADVCQECAVAHDPRLPHNQQSLYYQMKFQMEHDRSATWADAMAHCTDEMKADWKKAMQMAGIEVEG